MKPLIENPEDIKLNEFEELQQILGNPPHRILRSGNFLILLAVGILIVLSIFIQYPDVIVAEIKLTTENPPVEIIAKTSGPIAQLNVKDNQVVKAGSILAVMDNTTKLQDLIVLEQFLVQIEQLSMLGKAKYLKSPEGLKLNGVLQADLSLVNQHLNSLKFSLKQRNAIAQIEEIGKQIKGLENLNISLKKEKKFLAEEVEIANNNFKRNQSLRNDSVISDPVFEESRKEALQKERVLEAQNAKILRNELESDKLQQEILILERTDIDKNQQFYVKLIESAKTLRSKIDDWKQANLLIASTPGKVILSENWSDNLYIQKGFPLLTIVSLNQSENIFAQARISPLGAGKVKAGQRANIQLYEFPYREYGMVKGQVRHIAEVPNTNKDENPFYQLKIDLPEKLITTYDSTLTFRQEMPGQARIITEKRTLLRRLLEPIYNILYNQDQ